jgi:hypothetical protein
MRMRRGGAAGHQPSPRCTHAAVAPRFARPETTRAVGNSTAGLPFPRVLERIDLLLLGRVCQPDSRHLRLQICNGAFEGGQPLLKGGRLRRRPGACRHR